MDLCRKFGWWASFIRGTTSFWTNIVVGPTSTVRLVSRDISLVQNCLLDVTVVLDLEDFEEYDGHLHTALDRPALLAEALCALQVACRTSHRWRTLYVAASSDYILEALTAVLSDTPAPVLRTFKFGCAYLARRPSMLFASPPFPFRGVVPALIRLHIMNAPFPWQCASFFSTIRDLNVVHVQHSDWPAARHLVPALSASPVLRSVSFIASGVRDSASVRPFLMPALVDLTLVYGSESLLRVFSQVTAPLLRHLTVSSFSVDRWVRVMDSFTFLPSITSLELFSGQTLSSVMPRALTIFRSLEVLKVRRDAVVFGDCLAAFPECCPRLYDVELGGVPAHVILSIVAARLDATRIHRVKHSLPLPLSLPDHLMFLVMECVGVDVRMKDIYELI
ncbi:hypothetical protein DFH06DRAFT_1324022 [Mycena polygramma]|nr:hypothetical protein DFH06DRAFT_1324022 [Mycena polygramma]